MAPRAAGSNTTLTQLDIGENGIGAEGGGKLAHGFTINTTLTQLHIRRNLIGDEGGGKLADATISTTLTQLDIGYNGIGAEGVGTLADALTMNTTLTQLDITWNAIGTEGGGKLADALTINTTVTQLHIIGTKHLRELALALPHVEQRVPQSYIGLGRVLKGLGGTPAGAVPIEDVTSFCARDRQPVDIEEDEVCHRYTDSGVCGRHRRNGSTGMRFQRVRG